MRQFAPLRTFTAAAAAAFIVLFFAVCALAAADQRDYAAQQVLPNTPSDEETGNGGERMAKMASQSLNGTPTTQSSPPRITQPPYPSPPLNPPLLSPLHAPATNPQPHSPQTAPRAPLAQPTHRLPARRLLPRAAGRLRAPQRGGGGDGRVPRLHGGARQRPARHPGHAGRLQVVLVREQVARGVSGAGAAGG